MLTHFAIGPTDKDRYLVVYLTPGCTVPTVTDDCRSAEAAAYQANQRNLDQIEREKALRFDMRLLGHYGYTYAELSKVEGEGHGG